jgi:hypothetical protein
LLSSKGQWCGSYSYKNTVTIICIYELGRFLLSFDPRKITAKRRR